MGCKTTSPTKRRAGFSLVEGMVALAIAGICGLALVAFSMFIGRGLLAMSNHMD